MNQRDAKLRIPDVQSSADTRRLAIERVGIKSIRHPARIAVGDRDATVTIDECVAAVRRIPNGELEVLPRTPHPFEKAPIERIAYSLAEFFGA